MDDVAPSTASMENMNSLARSVRLPQHAWFGRRVRARPAARFALSGLPERRLRSTLRAVFWSIGCAKASACRPHPTASTGAAGQRCVAAIARDCVRRQMDRRTVWRARARSL
jgi:hypothetical protein